MLTLHTNDNPGTVNTTLELLTLDTNGNVLLRCEGCCRGFCKGVKGAVDMYECYGSVEGAAQV